MNGDKLEILNSIVSTFTGQANMYEFHEKLKKTVGQGIQYGIKKECFMFIGSLMSCLYIRPVGTGYIVNIISHIHRFKENTKNEFKDLIESDSCTDQFQQTPDIHVPDTPSVEDLDELCNHVIGALCSAAENHIMHVFSE
jgi:hypothetical protein